MTEKGLAIREGEEHGSFALTPREVVEGATEQSKLLMSIVEQTQCYQEIAGKKYLQVEAWETIGAFNRVHAETESITPIKENDKIVGYQARVQLWKDGQIVGGAVMPCYFTENPCKGKEGDAIHKACMSAAQTFATSKAYRMNYSYVAILAGYQPMPAEEITDDMRGKKPQSTQDKSEHWCPICKVPLREFTKGKKRWWAHKTSDGKWHNEADIKEMEKEQPQDEPEPEPMPQPSEGATRPTAQESDKIPRDLKTITSIEKLAQALKADFGLSYQEMWDKLGLTSWNDLTIKPSAAYQKVAEGMGVAH